MLLFGALSVFSQGIHYGYPQSINELKSGDAIFLNIPAHQDGKFLSDGGIEEFISFLNSANRHSFEIRIHFFYGSEDFRQSYSEFIAICLTATTASRCTATHYTIIGCGDTNPIFLDKTDEKYQSMNTLMEVRVL